MSNNGVIMRVHDVAELFQISISQAYKIIKCLNKELEQKGYYINRGRIPRKYLEERFALQIDE